MLHAKPLNKSPGDDTAARATDAPADRSYFGIVVALFLAYLLLASALFYFRGFRGVSPDRWAPFLFLVALALGRGRGFIRDWIPFVALLFGYQYMRGVAGQVVDADALTAANHGNVQLDTILDLERWLFLGAIPSIWLQERLYTEGVAHWYDVASGLVYLLHFVFPLVFAFALWLRNKEHYWRFVIALVAMSYIAFLFFLLLPTAPPWLAQEWGVIQGLERPSGQAYRALLPHRANNLDTFQIWTRASPNPVAAFPSLHAAFPWLVMLYAQKFFGRIGWSLILYSVWVWFSIVYFGLHWVVDILAGIVLATAVFLLMERLWPRLAAFPGLPWPAWLTIGIARTRSVVAHRAASLRRRVATHPLAPDALGVLAVAAIGATSFLVILQRGSMAGIDAVTQFYPTYAFLGDQLRDGNLPGWIPHWYGGMPFIADPQSGWGYLPAMVLFTLLPLKWAIQFFLAFHLLLIGLGAYTLARLLGLSLLSAVVAAAAFQLNGWMVVRSACCPVDMEVMTWLPFALIGVELAVRYRGWLGQAAGWSIASVAMSQILAAWLGQGGIYASLAIGGYLIYRTLLDPPAPAALRHRVAALALHGSAIGLLSFALAAAALLPRLEFLAQSSLADGYPWEGVNGGFPSLIQLGERVLGRTSYAAGAATLTLAGIGIVLGGRRYATPFFTLLALGAALLALEDRTPLHHVLSLVVPRFEDVNSNLPQRSLMLLFLPVAMLAGIAVESLRTRSLRSSSRLIAVVLVGLLAFFTLATDEGNRRIGPWTLIPILAVGLVILGASVPWLPGVRRTAPMLLLGVLIVDLVASGHTLVNDSSSGLNVARFDLHSFDDPPPAAAYLLGQSTDERFRFVGYDAGRHSGTAITLYRRDFDDPALIALLVNNRGVFLGLDDLQGTTNPLHLPRFDDLLTATNGFPQDYHDAHIYPTGLDSPLLDLLNVRYLVVPDDVPPGRPDLLHLSQRLPTVYHNGPVRILENPNALPRAWLVHEARQVPPGEALPVLTSGQFDPANLAVLETTPPDLAIPQDPAADTVAIDAYAPDAIDLTTHTDAPGMVILSEVYDANWKAYIDGEETPVMVANHALRAVAVPPGEHTIELRYESRSLQLGLISSATTTTLIAAVIVVLLVRQRRSQTASPPSGR